jgi:hypothetical protein
MQRCPYCRICFDGWKDREKAPHFLACQKKYTEGNIMFNKLFEILSDQSDDPFTKFNEMIECIEKVYDELQTSFSDNESSYDDAIDAVCEIFQSQKNKY